MKKLMLFAALSGLLLVGCKSGQSKKPSANTQDSTTMASPNELRQELAVLGVQGSCDMCKVRIEKTALATKGVSAASWDSEDKQLHVSLDASQTSIDAISKALALVGHDTDVDKADLATYNALPGCCKYRK